MNALVQNETAGAPAPVFRRLEGWCESRLSLPVSEVEEHIRENRNRKLPKLHQSPEWGKWKGRPIAIVGGGPSLRKTISTLAEFPGDVMVCGSAHDFVVKHGIMPKYTVVCSARNDQVERGSPADFLTNPVMCCEYLIASCCHPSVFDALCDQNVTQWNNWFGHEEEKIFEGEPIIGGGSTVTLRALSIAITLGYHEVHFFGFDSCFDDAEDNHAYNAGAVALEHDITLVRVENAHDGTPGREFLTHVAWLVQARDFQETLEKIGHLFMPTIHGDGMIAEIMRQAEIKAAKQQENKA